MLINYRFIYQNHLLRCFDKYIIQIGIRGKSTGTVKKLSLTEVNYQKNYRLAGEQEATAVSKVFSHNHEMGGRNRYNGGSGNMNRYSGGGHNSRGYNNSFDNNRGYNDFNNGNNNDMMNMLNNDLMHWVTSMANNFNMNPPPPPPTRMNCGDLRSHHCGMQVELTGRLIKKRVPRFVELRDRNGGASQLVILEDKYPRIARRMFNMPENTTLTIVGTIMQRPQNSFNQTMPTGEIEVEVQDILNIGFPSGSKGSNLKRNYSTVAAPEKNCGITSTEYKMTKSENILKYFENREQTCNDLRRNDIGNTVTLVGWIPASKNSKFMQLKDGYGQTQIIIEDPTLQETCLSAPDHTIVQITGKVLGRPRANINLKYDTGEIEVLVESVKVLNPDDPYTGPIKKKNKQQKLSIDGITNDGGGDTNKSVNGSVLLDADKVADTNKFADRTHNCDELTIDHVGEKVVVCGWLEFQRMNKFLVLRDGYGQLQVLIADKLKNCSVNVKAGLPLESIIRVEGTVIPRTTSTINPNMKTGHIEVDAEKLEVLNYAIKNLPFEMRKYNRAGERLRLTHRYLDLRFPDMQRNLRLRSATIQRMREYLITYLGFVEVETPTLFRRTPGGAQEFVVPTQKAGHFYSLVQSPQQFKQMLMAGAIDRYFQVARCYRDEATRPDRQPEFTQLDIELSFTTREGIMQLVEELLRYAWPKELPTIDAPFPQMTYDNAMESYGTDKPDTRFGFQLNNVTELVGKSESLQDRVPKCSSAYAIVVRENEAFLNGQARKHHQELSKNFDGILFTRKFTNDKDALERLSKLLGNDVAMELNTKFNFRSGDLLFLAIGEKEEAQTTLGQIRLDYYNLLLDNNKIKKSNEYKFLWVIDFPMFAHNATRDGLESVHHPFTAPHVDDMEKFKNAKADELVKIRSQAYDLVLNGQEIGGGSMRIHNRSMQEFVLQQVLKIQHEHLLHLLNALESGCPPHGGIALGLDRLMAIICNARSIRDVIAFPKSLNGRDPLSNAPVPISEEEKSLYHLKIVNESNDTKTDGDADGDGEIEGDADMSPSTLSDQGNSGSANEESEQTNNEAKSKTQC